MEPLTSLSVTQVQAYLACPLKFRFQYVDGIPRPWRVAGMAFGSSIHAAVEWFQRERVVGRTPALADVVKIFDADWYAANLEPLVFSDRESRDGLAEKGRAMLQLYLEALNGTRPVAVEQFFELDLTDPETGEIFDLKLRGIVDLVEEDGTLVDLKTAGRSMPQEDVDRHLQLSTYALGSFLKTGEVPKLRLDVLLKTSRPRLERYTTSRSVRELAWTANLVGEVASAIQAEIFFPSPSWRCAECEYFQHCQAWRRDAAAGPSTSGS